MTTSSPPSGDAQLLDRAIAVVTNGNRSAFGRWLGHTDGSTVRAWLRGRRPLPDEMRRLCESVTAEPEARAWQVRRTFDRP